MRILIIHNYYQDKGGEDVVFQQEVQELGKSHTVQTLTFKNKKGFKGLIQFASYPWNITSAKQVLQKAKYFQPDIIHIHNTHYALGPLVFRMLHQHGFKVVQTLHNYRLLDPSATLYANGTIFQNTLNKEFPWYSVFHKTLDNSFFKTFWTALTYYLHLKLDTWKKVDKYLVLTPFMKELLLNSAKKIKENQIAIKANAICETTFESPEKKNTFVYIGRLSQEKGIQVLLDAFKKNPSFNIEIFGSGPLENLVELASSQYNNIQYKGFKDKEVLHQAISSAQALIVPSIWFEGMPMTILESLAAGTPIILSKIGALSSLIEEDKTGFYFKAGDSGSLTEVLIKFSAFSEQQKQILLENCIKEYKTKYSIEENIKTLVQIYENTINKN